jgi:hypothetical protein
MPANSASEESKMERKLERASTKMPIKSKMKADVRRVVLRHALSITFKHNQLPDGLDLPQRRAALQLRTLRTFFCSRSFSAVFFTSSDKEPNPKAPALMLND